MKTTQARNIHRKWQEKVRIPSDLLIPHHTTSQFAFILSIIYTKLYISIYKTSTTTIVVEKTRPLNKYSCPEFVQLCQWLAVCFFQLLLCGANFMISTVFSNYFFHRILLCPHSRIQISKLEKPIKNDVCSWLERPIEKL